MWTYIILFLWDQVSPTLRIECKVAGFRFRYLRQKNPIYFILFDESMYCHRKFMEQFASNEKCIQILKKGLWAIAKIKTFEVTVVIKLKVGFAQKCMLTKYQ